MRDGEVRHTWDMGELIAIGRHRLGTQRSSEIARFLGVVEIERILGG